MGLLLGVTKLGRVGVLKSRAVAEAKVGVQGEKGPWDLESCFGV